MYERLEELTLIRNGTAVKSLKMQEIREQMKERISQAASNPNLERSNPNYSRLLSWDAKTGEISWKVLAGIDSQSREASLSFSVKVDTNYYLYLPTPELIGIHVDEMVLKQLGPNEIVSGKTFIPRVIKLAPSLAARQLGSLDTSSYVDEEGMKKLSYCVKPKITLDSEFGTACGIYAIKGLWRALGVATNEEQYWELPALANTQNSIMLPNENTESAVLVRAVSRTPNRRPDRLAAWRKSPEFAFHQAMKNFITAHSSRSESGFQLPGFTLLANDEFRVGLLAQLLDHSGYFKVRRSRKPFSARITIQLGVMNMTDAFELKMLAHSLGVTASISLGSVEIDGNFAVELNATDLHAAGVLHALRNHKRTEVIRDFHSWPGRQWPKPRIDMVPISSSLAKTFQNRLPLESDSQLYKSLKAAIRKRTLRRKDAKLILADAKKYKVVHEHLVGFKNVVELEGVSWHGIKDVACAETSKVMHQPMVYGNGNYISSTGLILPAIEWRPSAAQSVAH